MDKLPPPKKLSLDTFELLCTLGTGSFGRVKLARENNTKQYYAIKILKKAEIIRLKQVDHLVAECTILGSLNHPFLVRKNND